MSSIKNNNMSKIKKSKSAATPASTPTIAPTADEFPDVPDAIRPTLHCIVDKICAFESRLQRSHRDDVKLLCQHLELRYSEYSSRFILTFSEQRW